MAFIGPPTYSTTFPSTPVDGHLHILVDSTTNPSYSWMLRFNSSSTSPYKWEFVGGAPKTVNGNSTILPAHAGDYYIEAKGNFGTGGTATGADQTSNLVVGGSTVDQITQNGSTGAGFGDGSGSSSRGRAAVSHFVTALGVSSSASITFSCDENTRIGYLPVRIS